MRATIVCNFLCLILSFSSALPITKAYSSELVKNPMNDILAEGKTYTYTVGSNNYYATANISRKGDHYTITVPIWILGASLFGLTTQEEVVKYSTYNTDKIIPEYFKPNVKNFDEHPFLKDQALKFINKIEKIFSTSNLTLKLDYEFVKDETFYFKPLDDSYKNPDNPLPYAYHMQTSMINRAQKHMRLNSKKFPFIIQPFDIGQNISPVGYTLYGDRQPSLIAHEMGHVLGIPNEAYWSNIYPLRGLMTSDTQLKILSEQNNCIVQSAATEMDFYSILLAVANPGASLSLNGTKIDIPNDVIDRLQKLGIDQTSGIKNIYKNEQGHGWNSMTPKERTAAVLKRINENTEESKNIPCSEKPD